MKVQRGEGKKSSGRYHMQYEEEYFYEEDAEGEDESDMRQRWPARSADGKFRVRHCMFVQHATTTCLVRMCAAMSAVILHRISFTLSYESYADSSMQVLHRTPSSLCFL